jgi:hypothetical protein
MPTTYVADPRELLDAAYRDLAYDEGVLLRTSDAPDSQADPAEWRDRGEWLLLGYRMGAERIFFVDDDPVVIFSTLPSPASEGDIVAAYRRAWSMGRAKCLFLAADGELRVYALNRAPPRSPSDPDQLRPIDYADRAADVAERLAAYHRERIETGLLFEDPNFVTLEGRADSQLLYDVAAATDELVASGLSRATAHALIERVILVRYLEDRRAITASYFIEIARQNPAWASTINAAPSMPTFGATSTFVSCLSSRSLTYDVFSALERTFNGDMFYVSDAENRSVDAEHLTLVQQMLTGAGFSPQQPLFLWAYDFSVVPTSLIGSMYEQFYRSDISDKASTHYTPQELAEHVIVSALTPEWLAKKPKICDPACGSGIFLVEAFRRIVRYEMSLKGARLTSAELRDLLLTRLGGVDVNGEAIRLAAFSLYLALLNYQEPPDIAEAGRLPHLIYRGSGERPVLVEADAFSPFIGESLDEHVEVAGADVNNQRPLASLPWPAQSFDIVVGNPPWDEPEDVPKAVAELWADREGRAVGDRSPSQLFMWRALTFIKPGGKAALLIAATALHNSRSRDFRRQWLGHISLESVTDFTSVRRWFFNATAPFALVIFRSRSEDVSTGTFTYRGVRPSASLRSARSMSYAHSDQRRVEQDALREHDYLWKTYAWGGHNDAALMARLDVERQLGQVVPDNPAPGWGYQRGDKNKKKAPSEYLASIPSLRRLELSGPLLPSHFEPPPEHVKRWPDERRYSGQRILVSEGIRPGFGPVARLVYEEFSFRHIIYCIPLPAVPSWQAKILLATLISSLGRYRMFMRGGSWGLWRDKINAEDILAVPARIPSAQSDLTARIAGLVDRLSFDTPSNDLYAESASATFSAPRRQGLTREILAGIDEAIFDLFDLADAERDLVDDFHRYTVELAGGAWRRASGLSEIAAPSVSSGLAEDLTRIVELPIRNYLDRFLTVWNRNLGPSGEFSWEVVSAPRAQILGAIFETRDRGEVLPARDRSDWSNILERFASSLDLGLAAPRSDLIVRAVTDTGIVIVKRAEARLWSATAAREDAEATILQAMRLQDA